MNPVIYVILAGGNGERLWPLSKRDAPKQIIPFLGDSSLLEQTIDRITSLIKTGDEIWVITTQAQQERIAQKIGNRVHKILAEPVARNTGPAILLACLQAQQTKQDCIFVVLPSDHFIPDKHVFCQNLVQAIEYARIHDDIALFGLVPTYPATGYGYIQAACKHEQGDCYHVARFHEKPDRDRAQVYIEQRDMFWNIGIFVGLASVFIREFVLLAPHLYDSVFTALYDETNYQHTESISIDYAILEKSVHTVVFPVQFEWYDVGNLYTFLLLNARFAPQGPVISFHGQDNMASSSKKLVACIGVSDLCIIETDDVLLIAKKDMVEDVKALLATIKTSHESVL